MFLVDVPGIHSKISLNAKSSTGRIHWVTLHEQHKKETKTENTDVDIFIDYCVNDYFLDLL